MYESEYPHVDTSLCKRYGRGDDVITQISSDLWPTLPDLPVIFPPLLSFGVILIFF